MTGIKSIPLGSINDLSTLLDVLNRKPGKERTTDYGVGVHGSIFMENKKIDRRVEAGPPINIITMRLTESELYTLRWALQTAITQSREGDFNPKTTKVIEKILKGLGD
jgi:hypothetical protein